MVAILPWALAALPLVILTSVVAFREGNLVGAVANGILSSLTLCQNGFWGLVVLVYTAAGQDIPPMVQQAKGYMDGAAFLSAACMLLCLTAFFAKIKSKTMSFFMGVICLGFCCMGLGDLGIANLRLPAGSCIIAFAAWMIYSGCAMLVEHVLGKKVLPY